MIQWTFRHAKGYSRIKLKWFWNPIITAFRRRFNEECRAEGWLHAHRIDAWNYEEKMK